MRAAKARALIHKRDFVLPDDIRALLPHVLSHRIWLSPEAEMEGFTVDQVLRSALDSVPYAS